MIGDVYGNIILFIFNCGTQFLESVLHTHTPPPLKLEKNLSANISREARNILQYQSPDRWRSLQTGGASSRQVGLPPEMLGCLQTGEDLSRQVELAPDRWSWLQTGGADSRQVELLPERLGCLQTGGDLAGLVELAPEGGAGSRQVEIAPDR